MMIESVIVERKCRLSLADVRWEKWMRDEQKQTPQDVCGEAMSIRYEVKNLFSSE